MSAQNRETTRRAFVARLAAAPVAGLPAAAGAISADYPIFSAFAAYEQAKAAEDMAWEACEHASDTSHAALDAAGMRRVKIPIGWVIDAEHSLRLSGLEYEAALSALEADEREYRKITRPAYEADKAAMAAAEAAGAAERALFETAPVTRAGALRMLRHIAELLDDDDVVNDTRVGDLVGDTIRNAIAVFESEARS